MNRFGIFRRALDAEGTFQLTNRRQFSMVYTLIDHKMTSKNVQNSSGTTSRRRVVSLPSFGHFMASFYGL